MRRYLEAFFEEFDYPMQAREALMSAYDAMSAHPGAKAKLNALIEEYRADINCNFAYLLEGAQECGGEAGVHEYTAKLLLCICLSGRLREHFVGNGLGADLWRDAMYDLRYKLMECRLVYGIWGSFVSAWFDRFFNATRFALGRLQFETIPFGTEYVRDGLHLLPDSMVINVHIPRTGEGLNAEAVRDSYRRAAAFFREKYGMKQIVFVCSSWLLYPKNLEVLSEESNIRRFASDYTLGQWGEYADYSEVWRLFDANYTGNVELLPQDTSLRCAYANWIRTGVKTGWGRGIYVYEG